jgi:hypothetical protein
MAKSSPAALMTAAATQPGPSSAAERLAVLVRGREDGPELMRELLTEADLRDPLSELWLHKYLRNGRPDVPLADVRPTALPMPSREHPQRCTGFALEAVDDDGSTRRQEFTVKAACWAAVRAARKLRAGGRLDEEGTYTYELVTAVAPPVGLQPAASDNGAAMSVAGRPTPLEYLTVPLPPLLKSARPVGELDDGWFPVLWTEEAFARCERFARKGARAQPAVETGAVLIGPLCSCPETGEFFAIVRDAIEVLDADEGEFSLSYSGQSWKRIQSMLRVLRGQPETRADRVLGQGHGHNFPVAGGAAPCEICSQLATCTRTNACVSEADRTWSRAVFGAQPWQLCLIFGSNGRSEPVHQLFGLRDGRLLERGYHVIPDFPTNE